MNLYVLVEGSTEKHVYPSWLSYLLPKYSKIDDPFELDDNNYYIFGAEGYPGILDDIPNAIEDITEAGNFDYLLIVVDADEVTVAERREEIVTKIQETTFDLNKVIIVVQNHCIETWCLGNRKVYSRNPNTANFIECKDHYCVKENDPELMPLDTQNNDFTTRAQYHEYYLKNMLAERNIKYSKGKRSKAIQDRTYFEEMLLRVQQTEHLNSFREFIYAIRNLPTA
ncbi:hypothetical protein L2089_15410 [Paenibacillus hunanensis]|uniref:hypothetical protein n=1 Tax=Paenibacillus hunanensis TaxID=539262 RepID=UPI0020260ECC|nr:hypothetical protein [Paenibacillus hunanensis]MCL9662081.1 hypothetical protein [Paenibacillus hunanensis]